ncbi:MAG: amino-acid N-acetyltransferase [Verrucomicrobia bacterium]|nr:amino-acid N-acetyltransferase [Verrucomicrobiota bacterium]MCF7709413.1 amino-acid N-acetyltransferase [Verrucomicrobiota bacterium]
MKPTDLRGILQYIPRFRERTFVISLDGAIVTDDNFGNILLDIAVLRSLNIRVVLVHGASAQIRQLAKKRNIQPSDLDGAGITNQETLDLALTAANRLTHEILEGLATNNLRGISSNAVVARPLGIIDGKDHQFTGKIERIDTEIISSLLAQGVIPVIPPLGFDGEGNTYRLNSDHVAAAVAHELNASKLIFMTSAAGLIYHDKLIPQLSVRDLDDILATDKTGFPKEQISKAVHASIASRSGTQRVHIIDGRTDEGLLTEIFSNEGIGTLIYVDEYQQIRSARRRDIRSILALIRNAVASGEITKRTAFGIERQINDYFLFEIDDNPVACIALHKYPELGKGELACLCVNPSHEKSGIGKKLVHFVEAKAREAGIHQLFALSTQAYTFFQNKAGFSEGSPDVLPPERREKYEQSGRHSKILVKNLRNRLTQEQNARPGVGT